MGPRTSWTRLACVALLGCGGQVGAADAGSGGADGADAASTADAPLLDGEASTGEADGPPVACSSAFVPDGTDGGCSLWIDTECGSTSYATYCSCPVGTCTCTSMAQGAPAVTTTVAFSGCPSCDLGAAEKACGFPFF